MRNSAFKVLAVLLFVVAASDLGSSFFLKPKSLKNIPIDGPRIEGSVKWYDKDGDYGVINPTDGSRPVFFGKPDLKDKEDATRIEPNMKVSFETTMKGTTRRAKNLVVLR